MMNEKMDNRDNWYALLAVILTRKPVDEILKKFGLLHREKYNWLDHDVLDCEIVERYLSGESAYSIADDMNVCTGTIYKVLRKNGVKRGKICEKSKKSFANTEKFNAV